MSITRASYSDSQYSMSHGVAHFAGERRRAVSLVSAYNHKAQEQLVCRI